MAYTVQEVIDIARIPLNDDAKVRYSDATLLSYFNMALLLTRKDRPDLFLGRWFNYSTKLALTENFPLGEEYVSSFADYVTGRAELVDDEHVENQRAMALIQNFEKGILGR